MPEDDPIAGGVVTPPRTDAGALHIQQPLSQSFDGTLESHQDIMHTNAVRQLADSVFESELNKAIAESRQSNDPYQAEIHALLAFKDKPLTPKYIMRIAHELSERGASNETVEFLEAQKASYERNGNTRFFESADIKQIKASELQRAGRNNEAIKISDELLVQNSSDAEAWRSKAMAEVSNVGPDISKRATALKTYEQGFAQTADYSLGMGAVNAALESGDVGHAEQLAKLVSVAAKNVGADQSKSFWPAMVNAQATAISGSPQERQAAMLHLVEVLHSKDENGTPLVSDVQKTVALERIEIISGKNADASSILQPVSDRLEMSLGIKPETPLPYQKQADVDTVFTERGYHSRQGVTPGGFEIKGNINRGSMLPDSVTTPEDKRQFLEVAKTPLEKFVHSGLIHAEDLPPEVDVTKSLADVSDLETRVKASQVLARGIYNVDDRNLETLKGVDHKIYDSVVRLKIQQSGANSTEHLNSDELTSFNAIRQNKDIYASLGVGARLAPVKQAELAAALKEMPAFKDASLGNIEIIGNAQELVKRAELFRSSDTRTNIAVSAEQGLGDCRQVASATEGLVSAVQQANTSEHIMAAAQKLAQGDNAGYQASLQSASRELGGYEMRIYDQSVKAAVEVKSKYDPVLTKDGKFVAAADSAPQLIETHQHDVLRINSGAGEKPAYVVADAFYQKGPYRMGWVENTAPEVISENGSNLLRLHAGEVEAIVCQRDAEGRLVMDKDNHPIPVLDEAGQPKTVKTPLILESTKYSSPDSQIRMGTAAQNMLYGGSVEGHSLATVLQDPDRKGAYNKAAQFVVDNHGKGVIELPELTDKLPEAQARVYEINHPADARTPTAGLEKSVQGNPAAPIVSQKTLQPGTVTQAETSEKINLLPEAMAPISKLAKTEKAGGAGTGAVLGTIGLSNAIKNHDGWQALVSGGNIVTGAADLYKVLAKSGQLTPALEKTIGGLGKANVYLTIADGAVQIYKEDGVGHKVQRGAEIGLVAGVAGLGGALGGGVLSTIALPAVVGYAGEQSINAARDWEQVSNATRAITPDLAHHAFLQVQEILMHKELDAAGVTKDAQGHYDLHNQENVRKFSHLLEEREKSLSKTIKDNTSHLPTVTDNLNQMRSKEAMTQDDLKRIHVAEIELADAYLKTHPEVAAAANTAANPTKSVLVSDNLVAGAYTPISLPTQFGPRTQR